jgi:hypothetical protein
MRGFIAFSAKVLQIHADKEIEMDMPAITDSPIRTPNMGEIKGVAGGVKGDSPGEASDSQGNEDSEAYNLSFSDEGWDAFDGKGKKEEKSEEKEELSEEEKKEIEELKKVDKNVHVHEQAHLSAAGGYARGGANYEYTTGPDGKRYAVAGHVNMDTGPEKTPEATIRKAETIRRAALAPADPSSADRQIAAEASKMAQEAQREIAIEQQAESF